MRNAMLNRLDKLESILAKPAPREVRLLSSLAPDFEQQRAEALERGAFVISLVPLQPLPPHEGGQPDAQ